MDLTAPIPHLSESSSQQDVVEIRECGERLVELRETTRVKLAPQYFSRGHRSARPVIQVRESVAHAVISASERLPDQFKLLIWDGLRSINLQREIRSQTIRDLCQEGRVSELDMYVATVASNEKDYWTSPPPHCTGAALDLTLANESGQAINMGAEFDEFSSVAWLRHFEVPSHGGSAIQYRRRALYNVMMSVGFVGYEFEYWHYELGTLRAARHGGHPHARFGAATPWTLDEDI